MKQKLFGFCTLLCLLAAVFCAPFAAADEAPFDPSQIPYDIMVNDAAGLFTQPEAEQLEARAWELTQEYQCAVYIITLPELNSLEPWEATEYLMAEYDMGYGPDQSCIMLMLSMAERKYDIHAHGYGNIALTDYGKDRMAERFLKYFGDDDWYGGFREYLNCSEEYLDLARNGEPFDVGSDRSPLLGLAIGILVPLAVASGVCSFFKSQMKTANLQTEAQCYIDQQGLALTRKDDWFTHTTRSERYIEPQKSSGGTTTNSSGSSHKSGSF